MDKKQLKVECRNCGKWGEYNIEAITEEQRASGLCPSCYKKENSTNYALGVNLKDELVYKDLATGEEESAILTDEQIDNFKNLMHPVEYRLVPWDEKHFDTAIGYLFVDQESDYYKAIHNAAILRDTARMKAFERWKKAFPHQLIKLLLWEEDEVSEKKFTELFGAIPSASGKTITTPFLVAMREYCGNPLSSFVPQWQGFEFSVRDTIDRWGQLDARRYLIFKLSNNMFSYNEIDTLAIGAGVNLLLDAKSCGGIVDKSQLLRYIKFLSKAGITVSKGVFVTTEDQFANLGDNIFQFPFEWFEFLKSVDEVNLLIERFTR